LRFPIADPDNAPLWWEATVSRTILAETEEMQNRSIVSRLENWARCLRLYVPGWTSPSPIGGGLYSAESQWRSGFRSSAATEVATLDVHDAKMVESAVSILPIYYHAILKAWYVRKLSPGSCLSYAARLSNQKKKRFGVFDIELEKSHSLVVESLTVPEEVRRVRAKALALAALMA